MKNLVTLLPVVLAHLCAGQALPQHQKHDDPFLAPQGRFQGGLIVSYSGRIPPPVAIGDVMYGLTKRLSVGMTGGTTGTFALYGVKFNAALIQKGNWRILARLTSVYYPERQGAFLFDKTEKNVMPWMLSMATIDMEWRMRGGIRPTLGFGGIETHCMAQFREWLKGARTKARFPFTTFHTVQGGISLPVSQKLRLRPEVVVVLKHGKLIGTDEFRIKFPVNPCLNIVYTF